MRNGTLAALLVFACVYVYVSDNQNYEKKQEILAIINTHNMEISVITKKAPEFTEVINQLEDMKSEKNTHEIQSKIDQIQSYYAELEDTVRSYNKQNYQFIKVYNELPKQKVLHRGKVPKELSENTWLENS